MNGSGVLITVAVIGLVLVLAKLSTRGRRADQMTGADPTVDAALKGPGTTFDPNRDVPPGVQEALDRGQTIEAIKRFREATGAGLKESKDFVDQLRRRSPASR